MGEARFDPSMNMVEIEDETGSRTEYCRNRRGRYRARVAPGVIFPTEDLKIWRDSENRFFLIYDPMPKYKEVFEGQRSLEGLPTTKEGIAGICRIIGIVKTEYGYQEKRHTVHPHPQDPEIINAYVHQLLFYFNLDGMFVPHFAARRGFAARRS